MSTALLPAKPEAGGLRAWAATDEARLEISAAVGDIMPADQFVAHMHVAFNDEKVRGCSDPSKFRALMDCAAVALLPTLGQVVLIPYKQDLKAMPTWQGYKALMERHPDILEVVGVLVHLSDAFVMQEGTLQHTYDPFDEARVFKTSKDLRGGYCKIVYRDGRPPKYHMVRRDTIEQAQGCAQTQNVWKKWYYEMALKTVYRNAYARRAVPIDPIVNARLERAINLDDVKLGNDPVRIQSEASAEHLKEARQQREALDAKSEPEPEPDASQVNPDVDATEGVDEQPLEPSSDVEEAHIAGKLKAATTIMAVNSALELVGPSPWLSQEASERLTELGQVQIASIRSKRGAGSNPS